MNKFIGFLLSLCLIVPSVCLFSACGGEEVKLGGDAKALKEVAGTYSNVVYGTSAAKLADKTTITFTLENNGVFTWTIKVYGGITCNETQIEGVLAVDKDKNVVAVELDMEFSDMYKYFAFGNQIPYESDSYYGTSGALIKQYWCECLKNGITFEKDYMVMCLGMYNYASQVCVLYKENATKFEEGAILKTLTEKQAYDLRTMMTVIYGSTIPKYDADYYFVKDEYDLTNTAEDADDGKAEFIKYLEEHTYALVVKEYNNVKIGEMEIVDVLGFDLTTTGTKTGTIKYMNGETLVSMQVSYKVIDSKDGLPLMQVEELELASVPTIGVCYIAKGTEIYEMGWRIEYELFNGSEGDIGINEENCTGDTKIVNITGYNKEQVGYQVVTYEYRGASLQQAVFVYDETTCPYTSVYVVEGSKVVIKVAETNATTTYTMDLTDAKIDLYKLNGVYATTVALTQAQAIGLNDLSTYETGDEILFGYDYVYDGKTYTFYVTMDVEVVSESALV